MAANDTDDVDDLMVVVNDVRYRREDAKRLGVLPVETPAEPPAEPPIEPPAEPPIDPPVDPEDPEKKARGAANKARTAANKGA